VSAQPIRYRSDDEDSARWQEFPFRDGDIVISTRSKSGTTWMQMICALLVFQDPDLPAPLSSLSPWIDHEITPIDEVVRRLEAQRHRRFVKTHTPLDGVPIDARATYVVVCRDPRDMYISLWHQGNNIDRDAVRRLLGRPDPSPDDPPPSPRTPLPEALQRWIDDDTSAQDKMDGIRGVFHHASDAWRRREATPNALLVHYSDLLADLGGQMRGIAGALGLDVPEERWPTLVDAATFAAMRDRAGTAAPDAGGVLKDPRAFFRQGTSGDWRNLMTPAQVAHYEQRAAELAPPEVVAWLHH
jgi:aryl sulfotransferase